MQTRIDSSGTRTQTNSMFGKGFAGIVLCVTALLLPLSLFAQLEPINNRPNPYNSVDGWATLPDGREWGSTAGVDIDPDGRHLWAIDRCGGNSCAGSGVDPIVKIDPQGNVVATMGGGLMLFPHGLHVDRDGNVWVTDARGPDPDDPTTAGRAMPSTSSHRRAKSC